MTDFIAPPPPAKSPLVGILSSILIIVAAVAAFSIYKGLQANERVAAFNEQVASLTSQLEDSEKQIAELQPLAEKARTMPIVFRIDRHALSAGYTLYTFNRARISLRFHVSVNGGRTFNPVIDGGKLWMLRSLASGDVVTVASEGYDDKTITIQ